MNDPRPIDAHRTQVDAFRPDITASLTKVGDVLENLRFGSITLTVHDARVVQVDVTERTRLNG